MPKFRLSNGAASMSHNSSNIHPHPTTIFESIHPPIPVNREGKWIANPINCQYILIVQSLQLPPSLDQSMVFSLPSDRKEVEKTRSYSHHLHRIYLISSSSSEIPAIHRAASLLKTDIKKYSIDIIILRKSR